MTRCAVCEKPLPELAIKHGDPYCTATCCRKAHGCSVTREHTGRPSNSYAPGGGDRYSRDRDRERKRRARAKAREETL